LFTNPLFRTETSEDKHSMILRKQLKIRKMKRCWSIFIARGSARDSSSA
jgi:hypothetical protein